MGLAISVVPRKGRFELFDREEEASIGVPKISRDVCPDQTSWRVCVPAVGADGAVRRAAAPTGVGDARAGGAVAVWRGVGRAAAELEPVFAAGAGLGLWAEPTDDADLEAGAGLGV